MPVSHTPATITIRPAFDDDHAGLVRLAALDSAAGIPAGPILLAEVDDQLRAALSLSDQSVIADPFFPTQHLVMLLRARSAAVSKRRRSRGRRAVRRLRAGYAA